MLGTVVNAAAIIVGSLLGFIFRRGIPQRYTNTVMSGIALSVLLIGIMGAIETQQILLLIFSLVIGSIIGEFLKIEEQLEKLGKWAGDKVGNYRGNFARGFVTSSLLFCVGSMAIIGALESGLTGNHDKLFAKSVLDGITSIIFASTMGIGVIFSSISVFIYQGLITITAGFVKELLTEDVIREMSAIGGILIMALGFNMLEFKKIKAGNMLPAIFIPLIYYIGQILYFKILH